MQYNVSTNQKGVQVEMQIFIKESEYLHQNKNILKFSK